MALAKETRKLEKECKKAQTSNFDLKSNNIQ